MIKNAFVQVLNYFSPEGPLDLLTIGSRNVWALPYNKASEDLMGLIQHVIQLDNGDSLKPSNYPELRCQGIECVSFNSALRQSGLTRTLVVENIYDFYEIDGYLTNQGNAEGVRELVGRYLILAQNSFAQEVNNSSTYMKSQTGNPLQPINNFNLNSEQDFRVYEGQIDALANLSNSYVDYQLLRQIALTLHKQFPQTWPQELLNNLEKLFQPYATLIDQGKRTLAFNLNALTGITNQFSSNVQRKFLTISQDIAKAIKI